MNSTAKMVKQNLTNKLVCKVTDKIILEPTLHLDKLPHEDYGATFVKAFNHWLKIPDDKAEIIIDICDLVTVVLCIYDDVEDNAETRREGISVNKAFGIAHSILSANYVTLMLHDKVLELNHPKALPVFMEELKKFYFYDCIQLQWNLKSGYPTEEEYLRVTSSKFGAFYNIGVQLMLLFTPCPSPPDFSKLIYDMGTKFVLRDDWANLQSEEYYDYHGFCVDFTEGKCTIPTLHAIYTSKNGDRIVELVQQKTTDENLKKDIRKLLEEAGSLEYNKRKLDETRADILKQAEKIGKNPYFKDCLDLYKF